MGDRIAVLIPCHNEETTIEKVVKDYRGALPDSIIYVYNNNSSDRTVEIVERMAKDDSNVILKNEYQQGKGNVIRSMFRDIESDCYLMVDGDDTYSAENAQEMVDYVLDGRADMVIGDRLSSTYFTENKRPFHNFGNVLVRKMVNLLFKSSVNDIMTGYRAFSRRFVKGFPVLSTEFEIETEMTVHAIDKKFLLKEMPVVYRDRPNGSVSKLNTYSDGLKVLATIFNLFKGYRPFAFFGIIAFMLSIIALALFVPVIVQYMGTGVVSRMPSLIASTCLWISSLLSFVTGIILDAGVFHQKQLYELFMNSNNLGSSRKEF